MNTITQLAHECNGINPGDVALLCCVFLVCGIAVGMAVERALTQWEDEE